MSGFEFKRNAVNGLYRRTLNSGNKSPVRAKEFGFERVVYHDKNF